MGCSSNGLVNIHDIRNLSAPTSSILAHPSGLSRASFQAHAGLMSTVSHLDLNANSADEVAATPCANFGIHRSTLSTLSAVTEESITFARQAPDVDAHSFKPYTVVHPLRPFLGIGYGRSCFLKGAGVGKGDDTDSGSYSFLRAQAKYIK